jgi:hypothetical protein
MNASGPLPVSPVQSGSDVNPVLRVNQRITGEVVQISGNQVTLSVDGIPLVARLTSSDQSVSLQPQHVAHFIVRELTGQAITLQLLKPEGQVQLNQAPVLHQDLASRLLSQFSIPLSQKNLILAQAVLSQGLEITPQLMGELSNALEASGVWGETEAKLAASLKAAGLPVTASSLALISRDPQLGDSLVQLLSQVRAAVQADGFSAPGSILQRALKALESSIPEWDASPTQLAQQLQTASKVLGQSLEHILSERLQDPAFMQQQMGGVEAYTLMDLARLLRTADQGKQTSLAAGINQFLENLRQSQLFNATSQSIDQPSGWSQMDMLLRLPVLAQGQAENGQAEQYYPAQLRVARRLDGKGQKIDPEYTRLVVQVEISPHEKFQVDLSIAHMKVRAEVTAFDESTAVLAREELPELNKSLSALGYSLQTCSTQVGSLQPVGGLPPAVNTSLPDQALDVKV